MDYSAKNFTQFILYGQPRTASTTQFNLVCVCFVLHMKEHKPSLANATKCYFQGKGNHIYPSLDRPQVMKTHDVEQLSDFGTKTGTGIFITAPTKEQGRKMADSLNKSGKIAALIQDVETLSEIKTAFLIFMPTSLTCLHTICLCCMIILHCGRNYEFVVECI
ncbi:hypothetical protein QTG54_011736 [Skeletonema marinoi]|uniref:Uncharacterized protein n=1 Tax=Skeletonema marinoi TaxID=267567 RepID=A0AAD8Y260_9STRA|nr:hypothetical protein QTG54_011736 [Skeletonema marinoi]